MNNPPHVLSLYVYSSTGRHVYTGYKTNAIVRRKRDNRIDHRLVQAISNKLFKIRKSTTCFRDNLEILHTCSVTPCRPGGGVFFFFDVFGLSFQFGPSEAFRQHVQTSRKWTKGFATKVRISTFPKKNANKQESRAVEPFSPFWEAGITFHPSRQRKFPCPHIFRVRQLNGSIYTPGDQQKNGESRFFIVT